MNRYLAFLVTYKNQSMYYNDTPFDGYETQVLTVLHVFVPVGVACV